MQYIFSKNRLLALMDGVYAIAMTILVLNMDVASMATDIERAGLPKALLNMRADFFSYFLGFFLLGSLWLVHYRQSRYIKKVDEKYIWINIVGMMFISLIPFSVSLISDYGDDMTAALFFHINLLVAGLVFYSQWTYVATKVDLLKEKIDQKTGKLEMRRNILLPIVAVLAIVVAFVSPGWSMIVYMSIPLVKIIWSKNG